VARTGRIAALSRPVSISVCGPASRDSSPRSSVAI
jgi:hypothetical protein